MKHLDYAKYVQNCEIVSFGLFHRLPVGDGARALDRLHYPLHTACKWNNWHVYRRCARDNAAIHCPPEHEESRCPCVCGVLLFPVQGKDVNFEAARLLMALKDFEAALVLFRRSER